MYTQGRRRRRHYYRGLGLTHYSAISLLFVLTASASPLCPLLFFYYLHFSLNIKMPLVQSRVSRRNCMQQQQQQQGLNGGERRTVLYAMRFWPSSLHQSPSLARSFARSLQCYMFFTKDMTTIHGGGQVHRAEIALSLSLSLSSLSCGRRCPVMCPAPAVSRRLFILFSMRIKILKKKTSARVCLDRANGMSLDTKNHHQQQQQELHCCCRLCKLILWGRFTRG